MTELIWNGVIINFVIILITNKFNTKIFKFNQNLFIIVVVFHLLLTFLYILIFQNEPADFKTYLSVDEIKITNYGSFISSDLVHNLIGILKYIFF